MKFIPRRKLPFAILVCGFLVTVAIGLFSLANKPNILASDQNVALTSSADWNTGAKSNIDASQPLPDGGDLAIDLTAESLNLSSIYAEDNSRLVVSYDETDKATPLGGSNCAGNPSPWGLFQIADSPQTWTLDLGGYYNITSFQAAIVNMGVSSQAALSISSNGTDFTSVGVVANKCVFEGNTSISSNYSRYIKVTGTVAIATQVFGLSGVQVSAVPLTATHTSGLTQINGSADLTSWDSFTATETDRDQNSGNAATKIEYQFRTGDGNATWDAWTAKQEYSGSSLSLAALNDDASHRYLQVLSTFTTTNSSYTPTLSDYTINYTTTGICDNFDHVNISPTSDTIDSEGATSVTATAVDASDNPIVGVGVSYSADCGSVDGSGNYTAPSVVSQTICTITAVSDCGGSATSTITINPIITPTCSDGVQNGDETDIDCGGSCSACPTCSDGVQNGSETGVDCGGSCDACPAPETCDDGIQNQDETGIDCGGSCNACPTPPNCSDSIQNGDETGVDCGGSCSACPVPETCDDGIQNQNETSVDCGGVCGACPAPPNCSDGIQNGDESGADCGGSCVACPAPETCNDNIKNQDETAIDCGGVCPTCPTVPAPLVCPLPEASDCSSNLCASSLSISSPSASSRFKTGDTVNVAWSNTSSAVSLVEGWNIRYRLDISYDNGIDWNRIATDVKEASFANQAAWQSVFADSNWRGRMLANNYSFKIPERSGSLSENAIIKVSMYRIVANPYNCADATAVSSFAFVIEPGTIDDSCETVRYQYTSPLNIVNSVQNSNRYYYYLSQQQLRNWPNITLRFLLKEFSSNLLVDPKNFALEPQDLGSINQDGYLVMGLGHPEPRDFEISYYDLNCDKKMIIKVVAKNHDETGSLELLVPNGGEFWMLGSRNSIEWKNSFKEDVINRVTLELSLDGGKSWSWDVIANKELSSNTLPESVLVDSLSEANSFLWKIPYSKELATQNARIRISAFDSKGRYLLGDSSEKDFEISDSSVAAVIDYVDDNLEEINTALAALAIISLAIAAAIPWLQNISSLVSFREFVYGIILAGRKKKQVWGLVYDSFSNTPLPSAIVTLHDAITNRLIDTTVTDQNGRYGFIGKKGKFYIKVEKKDYEIFPPSSIEKHQLAYTDNYFGGEINVNEEDEKLLALNIPMVCNTQRANVIRNINILSAIQRVLILLNWPLIILGTIVSVSALIFYPNLINSIIMLLYVPIWISQFSFYSRQKAYGLVLDKKAEGAIDLALIRVFDAKTNRLVRTATSDMKGHYATLINNGSYRIMSQKAGYKNAETVEKNITGGIKPLSDTLYMEQIN